MQNTIQTKLKVVIGLLVAIVVSFVVLLFVPQRKKEVEVPLVQNDAIVEIVEEPVVEEVVEEIIDLESDTSVVRLVNQAYPIDRTFVPSDLVIASVPSLHANQKVSQVVEKPLEDLFVKAKEEANLDLMIVSGYRDYTEQLSLWYTYTEKYGLYKANRMDAHPGASEHQLGLAVDLGVVSRKCELYTCFDQQTGYDWLLEHAHEYGFILRYPKGKEDSTGISYAPWHFRYVGKQVATKIYDSNLSMEEYFEKQWK